MWKGRIFLCVGLAVLMSAGQTWGNDCLSHVDQQAGVNRLYRADYPLPADAVFTVTNQGVEPISYTVEKVGTCDWLTLDKSGGVLPGLNDTDQVTATIDPDGLASGLHSCQIKFTDDCDPAVESIRTVNLTVRPPATQWEADFTDWEGQDGGATSQYFNPQNPANPLEFAVIFQGAGGTGWLTQGTRGGVPTTAKFLRPTPTATGNGRARFGTNLPDSMTLDTNNGLSFAWKARYGNYSIGRGPVQLNVNNAANQTHRPYFRVQNGTNLRILRNGGGNWPGIDELTLPFNVANPQCTTTGA
jgi:hypothetical protein